MIGKLSTYKLRLEARRNNDNRSRENQSDRNRLEDIHSLFESRIRTGCISNLKHVDPEAFLNDCQSIFRRRINNMLRKYNFLKVWTIFCGEFTKISNSQTQINEFKYLNTKNYVLTFDDNVDVWFQTNIRDVILRELEEFQVRFFYFLFIYSINI